MGEPPRSIWPLNLLLFRVEQKPSQHGSSDLPANRRLQEADPRGGFKRCVLEVSPRGGSKRRLKEPAVDVQEEALSSKRFIQKVAPRDGSKRLLKEAKSQLQ